MDATRAVEKAKVRLLLKYPFFGKVACQLNWVEVDDPRIPTAATDGESVFWNKKFIESLSESDVLFVAAHEVHHVVKKHMFRRKDRKMTKWNMATDYQINGELVSCDLPKPSMDWIFLDKKYYGWLEEKIYNDIPDSEAEKLEQKMGIYGVGGVMDSPHRAGSIEEKQAMDKVDRWVEAAAQYAKSCGKLPGCLEEYCRTNRQHQVDWRAQLRRYVAPVIAKDLCWESPNRRMLAHSLYLPGPRKDGVGKVAVGIDTSGSICKDEIDQFCAELNSLFADAKPEEVHVMWFNTDIWRYDVFSAGEELKVPTKIQSGGTYFHPIWDLIKDRGINLKCLIMLTDMYADIPPRPSYPVIWCSTTNVKGPYGSTVHIKIKGE